MRKKDLNHQILEAMLQVKDAANKFGFFSIEDIELSWSFQYTDRPWNASDGSDYGFGVDPVSALKDLQARIEGKI